MVKRITSREEEDALLRAADIDAVLLAIAVIALVVVCVLS